MNGAGADNDEETAMRIGILDHGDNIISSIDDCFLGCFCLGSVSHGQEVVSAQYT